MLPPWPPLLTFINIIAFATSLPSSQGELWIAGPHVMKGYLDNPTANERDIVEAGGERYFKTGDIAKFDDKGRMFITDRLKEVREERLMLFVRFSSRSKSLPPRSTPQHNSSSRSRASRSPPRSSRSSSYRTLPSATLASSASTTRRRGGCPQLWWW